MHSLLNKDRPPLFCPGCSHDRIVKALDRAFQNMGLKGNQIVIVSDIGCSGLFDTFFNTHAFHGLHGRALSYATGLKLARPELTVVVTMGDGGMGIGGAHILGACRRNLDVTLLVLNNFNFGMTGGQFSATTPSDAMAGSGFLNQLEAPLDIGKVAVSAGATYETRCSAYKKDLDQDIEQAIQHDGFSLVDIWGICTGRYTKKNKLSPGVIDASLSELSSSKGIVQENARKEYGRNYRETASRLAPPSQPARIEGIYNPPQLEKQSVILLGSAGQRILTAGDLLCYAGLFSGLNTTQKNEYDITVLRGSSISEVILSSEEIHFTGIDRPEAIVAIGQEGVDRRKELFQHLNPDTLVIQATDVALPENNAHVIGVDFKSRGIKREDRALASLSIMARLNRVLTMEMLQASLKTKLKGPALGSSLDLIAKTSI